MMFLAAIAQGGLRAVRRPGTAPIFCGSGMVEPQRRYCLAASRALAEYWLRLRPCEKAGCGIALGLRDSLTTSKIAV